MSKNSDDYTKQSELMKYGVYPRNDTMQGGLRSIRSMIIAVLLRTPARRLTQQNLAQVWSLHLAPKG